MRNIILTIISVCLLLACEDESNSSKELNTHPSLYNDSYINLNADTLSDVKVKYAEYATDDLPSSGGSIIGSICPLNNNELLYRAYDGHLFLKLNDTIRKQNNTDADWFDYEADIISIDRHNETWDLYWKITSDFEEDFYLGIKLSFENSVEIGWLKLGLDTITGEISIVDSEFTSGEELVIRN